MKRFNHHEVEAAMDHAEDGGQALHVWDPSVGAVGDMPRCFARAMQAGKPFGHLLDCDHDRLRATAFGLGVRRVVVRRAGRRGQHVDLCGRPLEKAIGKCG